MEGSGFPDLESIRVRKNKRNDVEEDLLVVSPLKPVRTVGSELPPPTSVSLCRGHLVYQGHQVHQALPLSPQQAQYWARAPLDHRDGMERLVNL